MRALVIPSAAILLAACIASPEAGIASAGAPLVAEVDESVFAVRDRLLKGIEAPHDDLLAVGDAVLFGVALADENGARTWYVRVTSMEAEATISDGLTVRIELFDDSASLLGSQTVTLARYLVGGIVRGCVDFATVRVPGESMALTERGKARAAIVDVLRMVEQSAVLADVFWRVVRKPTTVSLLGGVSVVADLRQLDHAHPETNPVGEGSAFAFPLRILVNKTPAFDCRMIVVEPRPPLRLNGGVVSLTGHDSSDPRRRVVVQLLAAQTRSTD